jgi:hypothetical protein
MGQNIMPTNSTTNRRVTLAGEDIAKLQTLSETTRLSQVTILSALVRAGLEAVEKEGKTLHFPLQLRIEKPHGKASRP